MKYFATLFLSLIFSSVNLGFSQDINRLVILPFSASNSVDVYGLGLATSLQRTLNVIDNVYAPPVGDSFLYVQRLTENDQISINTIAEAFKAEVVLSGEITAQDSVASIRVGFAGPAYPEVKSLSLSANLDDPIDITTTVINAVIAELGLTITTQDREEINALTTQIPSVPSLSAVSQASLRLPTSGLNTLLTASELDGNSSWVQSEYARNLILANQGQQALETSLQAIQIEPLDIEAQIVRGIILQASGDNTSALQAFDRALEINPGHALALAGKGGLVSDAAEARTLLESATDIYPRLIEAYINLYRLQREQNPQRALQTLRQGAQSVPEAATLHQLLIQEALTLDDSAGALAYLRDIALNQTNPAASIYSLAALLPDSYSSEALSILEEGKALYPDNANLALAEADVLDRQAKTSEAENLLLSAYANHPERVDLANALALLQAKQGKLEEAKTTLSSLDNQSEIIQVNLGQLYLEAGQPDAALETFGPLVSNTRDTELLTLYGIALGRTGQINEAISSFDRALSINPNAELARQSKALLEQERNITGGQTFKYEGALGAAFAEGQAALQEGDFQIAADAFARARQQKDDGILAFYEGYSQYFSGQVRKAVTAYNVALTAFPESDIILNNLGLAQLQLGRIDLALDHLTKATQINSENANAFLNLGLANYESSRFEQAVVAWEKAISLNPDLEATVADRLNEARTKAQP